VAADVTHALRLLHQEGYSHPFLHGGNLSSNTARTKWYVHDLDASRLFDADTDSLSFATAAQMRDFFYIIEKYVFDRYLSSSNPEAVPFGFRNLEAILGAYFKERKRAGPLWQLETGYLVRGDTVHIDGGIEEVVEHYLHQLNKPGKSIVFRDILFPRHLAKPLPAVADLGAYLHSHLRVKGFNDLIRRSEMRSPDIIHPDEDDALAREYEDMQTFEAEAELQRQKHASSPKAFILKPRNPAAERQQLESKFRDVVFIRDWVGIQFLTLMTRAKQPADWKTLDRPVSKTYPAQAALDGIQLAAQTKGDTPVDFLFRLEKKKVILELRNAVTHRSLGDAKARDFIRQRFTSAGQALLGQLAQGKDADEIVHEVKVSRSEMRTSQPVVVRNQDGERKPEDKLNLSKKISGQEPLIGLSQLFSLKVMIEKAGPPRVFVNVAAPVESPEQTAGELSRLAKAGAQVVIYNLAKAQSDNELVRILDTFPKALFHSVAGSWSEALAGSEHAGDEMNLVHYSEGESEAKGQAPVWAEKRVIYLAGKAGSAAYGLSQIKALQAAEIKESLLAQLDIAEKNGFYFVSEAKSAWMRLQLEAESIVAFAQAA